MIKSFKEKAPVIQAIEFTSASGQSAEVANLIGATSIAVDLTNKRTVFSVPMVSTDPASPQFTSYSADEGQVIGLDSGKVMVMAAADFYAKYEVI